jgi:hypothetical protein
MKVSALSILLLFLPFSVSSQVPDWVQNRSKSHDYPEAVYLTGYGIFHIKQGDSKDTAMWRAADCAQRNLAEKLQLIIKTAVISEVGEVDKKYPEYFSGATRSASNLEISETNTEIHYDPDKNMWHAFAYIKWAKLDSIYSDKADSIRKEILTLLTIAKSHEESGNHTKALEEYLTGYPLSSKLSDYLAIIAASRSRTADTFEELDNQVASVEADITKVRGAVNRLVPRPIKNIEDLAWHFAHCLSRQINAAGHTVLVTPFTNKNTGIGSPFSRNLKQALEKELDVLKWRLVKEMSNFQPKTSDIEREFATHSGAQFVLTGTYWPLPNEVKFNASLRHVSDGDIVAGNEVFVSNSILRNIGFNLEPPNFAKAVQDQKTLRKDEEVDGGLRLQVITNKGLENLMFTKGERMRVFVRVNMPVYIRFIYHLADGTRTLLLDNHYMDQATVNQGWYGIPEEFECDAPFGVEFLQVFASTEKFSLVETVTMDGYDVLEEDLQDFLAKTRGMKRVKKSNGFFAESRIVITTVER